MDEESEVSLSSIIRSVAESRSVNKLSCELQGEELKRWLESYRSDAYLVEASDKSLPPQSSLWFALWLAWVCYGPDGQPGCFLRTRRP